MANPILDQRNYRFGADDNADPDLCTFDASDNTPKTNQRKLENFMIRLQVAEDAGVTAASKNWQLYYNTVDDPDTAIQVTQITPIVHISDGTPADQDPTTGNVCDAQVETWQNGIYTDASDASGKYSLAGNYYTEFQFCVQFGADAGDGATYYFYLFYNGAKLTGTYDNVAQVTAIPIDINKLYTKGPYAILPADDAELEVFFTAGDYLDVAVDDDIYVQQYGADEYVVVQWKQRHTNNIEAITGDWKGKCSIAPSGSGKAVSLQIYNKTDGVWETLGTNNTAGADVEFTLTGTQSTNLSKYYGEL